jgi:hypothetical protein
MSRRSRTFFALLAMSLGSCAVAPKGTEPAPPAGHNFAYRVPLREAVNLIQVFDDGSTTYLQFKNPPADVVDIRNEPGRAAIAYTADGNYLKIPGVYDSLRIVVANESIAVVNESALRQPGTSALESGLPPASPEDKPMIASPVPEAMNPPANGGVFSPGKTPSDARRVQAPPVGVPESLQTMPSDLRVVALKQEIATLEERVRALSEELDAAHRLGQGASIFSREVRGTPRIVLTFEDRSFVTRVDEHLADFLADAARAANRVYLHGHTDAYVASEAGTQLAFLSRCRRFHREQLNPRGESPEPSSRNRAA